MKTKPLMKALGDLGRNPSEFFFREASKRARARMKEGEPEPESAEWLQVKMMDDGDSAEIRIYGEITEFPWFTGDTSSNMIYDLLTKIDAKTIHVRINSRGGSVWEGVAIYNLLREKDARVIVHVDGVAASIASIIAMAGDEIVISEGATYMVHKPWTWEAGNSDDFRKTADMLDKIEASMLAIYQRRTTNTKAELKDMLREETFLTGEEAVDLGFCDRLAEDGEEEPAAPVTADPEPEPEEEPATHNSTKGEAPKGDNNAQEARDRRLRLYERQLQIH